MKPIGVALFSPNTGAASRIPALPSARGRIVGSDAAGARAASAAASATPNVGVRSTIRPGRASVSGSARLDVHQHVEARPADFR